MTSAAAATPFVPIPHMFCVLINIGFSFLSSVGQLSDEHAGRAASDARRFRAIAPNRLAKA